MEPYQDFVSGPVLEEIFRYVNTIYKHSKSTAILSYYYTKFYLLPLSIYIYIFPILIRVIMPLDC